MSNGSEGSSISFQEVVGSNSEKSFSLLVSRHPLLDDRETDRQSGVSKALRHNADPSETESPLSLRRVFFFYPFLSMSCVCEHADTKRIPNGSQSSFLERLVGSFGAGNPRRVNARFCELCLESKCVANEAPRGSTMLQIFQNHQLCYHRFLMPLELHFGNLQDHFEEFVLT